MSARRRALVAACLFAGACREGPRPAGAARSDAAADTPAADADTAARAEAPEAAPPGVPRIVPCGRPRVNVIVRAAALGAATDPAAVERALRDLAARLLAPLRDRVVADSIDVSPAIRALRVAVRDSTAVAGVVAELARHPDVEAAEPDECVARPIGR